MVVPCAVYMYNIILVTFVSVIRQLEFLSSNKNDCAVVSGVEVVMAKPPASPARPLGRNQYLQKLLQLAARRTPGGTAQIMRQWMNFIEPNPRSKPLDGEEAFRKLKHQLHSFSSQVAEIRERSGKNLPRRPTSLEDEKSLFLLRHLAYTIAQPIQSCAVGMTQQHCNPGLEFEEELRDRYHDLHGAQLGYVELFRAEVRLTSEEQSPGGYKRMVPSGLNIYAPRVVFPAEQFQATTSFWPKLLAGPTEREKLKYWEAHLEGLTLIMKVGPQGVRKDGRAANHIINCKYHHVRVGEVCVADTRNITEY